LLFEMHWLDPASMVAAALLLVAARDERGSGSRASRGSSRNSIQIDVARPTRSRL